MRMRCLVLGGSRGIGAALVRRLRLDNHEVFFSYNQSEEAARALEKETGACAEYCDASDSGSVRRFYAAAKAALAGIDAAAAVAGAAHFGLLQDVTDETWRRVLAVNLDSAFYLARVCLPDMISEKSGSIVFVSSMWGQVGATCEAVYSAAKAGVIGLTKALAKEVGPSGIRVNCVCPGLIDTGMNAHLESSVISSICEDTPLGRMGTADETAKAIGFLLCEQSSFITGQVLGVNGGLVI